MIEIVLTIDGMMCGMCESHVNDAVRNSLNVKSVKSSHKSGECHVVCTEDIDRERLVEVIEAQGYRVIGTVERSYEKKGLFSRLFKR